MRFVLGLLVASFLSSSSLYAAPSFAQLFRLSAVAIGLVRTTGDRTFNLRSMQERVAPTNLRKLNAQNRELRSTKGFYDIIKKRNLEFIRSESRRYLSFKHDSLAELYLDKHSYVLSFKCEGHGSLIFWINGSEASTELCQGKLKVLVPMSSILKIEPILEGSDLQISRVKIKVIDSQPEPEPEPQVDPGQSVVEIRSTKGFFDKMENKTNVEYIVKDKRRFIGFADEGSAELQLQDYPQKLNFNCQGVGELLFLFDGKEVLRNCDKKMVVLFSADATSVKIKSLAEEPEGALLIDGVKLTGYPNLGTKGNFQVKVDGEWRGVCCVANKQFPVISNKGCLWEESKRSIKDLTADLFLDCPERGGKAANCTCDEEEWENFHGAPGDSMASSLDWIDETGQLVGAPIFPNSGRETCVYVGKNGIDLVLKSRETIKGDNWEEDTGWPDENCPDFRLFR